MTPTIVSAAPTRPPPASTDAADHVDADDRDPAPAFDDVMVLLLATVAPPPADAPEPPATPTAAVPTASTPTTSTTTISPAHPAGPATPPVAAAAVADVPPAPAGPEPEPVAPVPAATGEPTPGTATANERPRDAGDAAAVTETPPAVDVAVETDASADTELEVEVDIDPDVEIEGVTGDAAPPVAPAASRPAGPGAPAVRAAAPPVAADLDPAGRVEHADTLAARVGDPSTITLDVGSDELGALTVTARAERGTVHLVLAAADERTRGAIVEQQPQLRHDLAASGVRLGSFDVTGGDARDTPSGAERDVPDGRAHAAHATDHERPPVVAPTAATGLDIRM